MGEGEVVEDEDFLLGLLQELHHAREARGEQRDHLAEVVLGDLAVRLGEDGAYRGRDDRLRPLRHARQRVAQEMLHPHGMTEWRATLVLPLTLSTPPYKPRHRRAAP
jgi:hypothetical protein